MSNNPASDMLNSTKSDKRILRVQDVSVSFDGFTVLNGLTFGIYYGELRFLIGPNGAGKTTLLDIITGRTKPSAGKVIFDEKIDASHYPEHKLVQHGIGRKFQTPAVFSSLSIYDNLEAAIGFKTPTYNLFSKLPAEQHDKVEEMLGVIGLKDKAKMLAGSLSHGQKQWLEIGMLLVQEPKLLLLDEPVAGMTRRERDHTGELLQEIRNRCSILVVEHDMQFVRQFASTVTVLHMGTVLVEDAVDVVQSDPRVIEVYLGHSHRQVA